MWQSTEKTIGTFFVLVFGFSAFLGALYFADHHKPKSIIIVTTLLVIILALLLWSYRMIREQMAERITAEAKSRGIQIFMETIFDHIPHMIFVKDAKSLRFTIFNKAGEDLLGYSRESLLGKNDYDLFGKEQADFFTNKDREVLAGGKQLDIPVEFIDTPQGTRVLHTVKIPILDSAGQPRYLLGISEDISSRVNENVPSPDADPNSRR